MKIPSPLLHRLNAWDILALLTLLGTLVFRLAYLVDARFAGDEAFMYMTARRVAEFKLFPVYGVNMTGEEIWTPGGLYHLVMAIPLLLSKEIEAPIVLTVLMNILGLGLGYRVFRREYGPAAAFGALALMAFNPFSVYFSDRHWNPDVLVPLGFLWLWLLLRAVRGEGRRPWLWLAILLAVAPQAHLSCSHLTLLTLAVLLVLKPRVAWRDAWIGAGIGVATYVPYFVWDGMNGFENTVAVLTHVSGQKAPAVEALRALYYQVLYGGGDFTYFLGKGFWFPMTEWGFLGGDGWRLTKEFYGLPEAQGWALAGAVGLGVLASLTAHLGLVGAGIVRAVRGGRVALARDPLAAVVLVNLPLMLGTLLLSRKAFYPHYTMVLFPLSAAALAWMLGRLRGPAPMVVAAVAAVALAAVQGGLCARYYETEESKTSLEVMREATRTILEDSEGKPAAFDCLLPRTRQGSYPVHILSREYFHKPFREDSGAPIRYALVPRDSPAGRTAKKVWEVGRVWLIRR